MDKKQRTLRSVQYVFRILLVFVFILGLVPATTPAEAQRSSGRILALPMLRSGSGTSSNLPLMSGVSVGGYGDAEIAGIKQIDTWLTGVNGGRKTTIWGTFLPIDLTSSTVYGNVEYPLTLAWDKYGYVPFVNLPALSGDSAETVATSSKYDTWIRTWATSFKKYANGGTRFAYIAPLQEMNGDWVDYGGDPYNFKRAFARFQQIFKEVGVPDASVKWVFAPNGWTSPTMPSFEAYYPGDALVDVVAMSSYNFGYCKSGGGWTEPDLTFNDPNFDGGHYLDRLYKMAPSKPIFVAQTATSSIRYSNGASVPAEKERWLREAYAYLSKQRNVRAVIYFNVYNNWEPNCDWKIFSGGSGDPGYKSGVNNNGYQYISPADLMKADHAFR